MLDRAGMSSFRTELLLGFFQRARQSLDGIWSKGVVLFKAQ